MEQHITVKKYTYFILGILVFLGLYLSKFYSYLLFHSLAEIFSIVVACGIFMVAWNSHRFLDNNYLLFLGIAFLFAGGLDLIHTLAYKGMGVFTGYGTNLATQFWIAARYTESLSLLIAPLFFRRKLKINFLFWGYTLAFLLLLLSIFYWNIFPVCFVEGVGLTPFKKISEYMISLILLASIALLFKHRSEFDHDVFKWVVWSIILTIASELAFTFYTDPYGFPNLMGHFFKIVSFYFIYKALIETGLTRPYDLLFRNLKQSEVLVREEKNRIQNYLDIAEVILVVIDVDQKVSLINKKGCDVLGYNENEILGKNWFNTFIPEKNRQEAKAGFSKLMNGEIEPVEYFENRVLTKAGEERMIAWHHAILRDEKGHIASTLGSGEDITERKKMEEDLRKSRDELEIKVQERTAELARAFNELEKQSRILNSFFKYTATPLVLFDKDFNFIRVNEAYAKACQREVSEFPGHNHFEFYPSNAKAIFEEVVETKKSYQVIARAFVFPDHPEWGKTYWDWTLTPILDAKGKVEYLVFSLVDVTKRVQMEKERTRLAHIIETTSDLVGMANLDRQLFYLNKAGRKMLGFGEEEDISGVRISDAHPDWAYAMVLNEGIPTALETGLWSSETAFLNRDGTEIPVSQIILAHKGPNGEVEFLSSIARDITERKRAEEAVKAERQRFNNLLEMLPVYLVLLTPDYHVPFANRFFRERFGESHGQRCFEYLFGRSEPCETCETYTALKIMAPHKWEWTGPDGRNYHVFDFPFTDTDGSTLILEMGIDITERKQAENRLQEQANLLELAHDAIIVRDMEGKIKFWNSGAEGMYGWTREEAFGKVTYAMLQTKFPKPLDEIIIELIHKGRWEGELVHTQRDGEEVTVASRWVLQKNEKGTPVNILEINNNITRRKEMERRTYTTSILLELFSKKAVRKEYLDAVVDLLRSWSGCRCVGIRVLDRQGLIPYESYAGFSQEFWESENWLSIKRDQCACIRVIAGNPDPQDAPMMTPGGAFHCDNTFKFLGQLSEEEKTRFRGVCIQHGFSSVSIVPIRFREDMIGAIHLADERGGQIPLKAMEFIESVAPLIGEALHRFSLEEEIRESENRLRHLSSQLLTIQEKERKRVAHELHDGLGQMLTAIKFKVENTLQQKGRGMAKEKLFESVIPMIRESVEEVRRIQMDLRPSILDDLGILATLAWFSREFQSIYSTIRIEKESDIQEDEVPAPLKTTIYRVTQEALNNIAKHSGADLVHLSLKNIGDKMELAIRDNGTGFDLEQVLSLESSERGFGLSGMRERVELSGGSFVIESIKGEGTRIRATWPL